MALITRGAPHGILVVSDCGKTEIRDPCTTSGIDKDVWLGTCQYGGETRFRTITHSLEISMDRIARVEVVEAFSDIR
jgi:hypothetical protein